MQESDEEESYHGMVTHFHGCEPDDGKHSPNDNINPTEGGFMNDHVMAPKAELRRFEGLKYFEGTERDHTAVHVRMRTAGKLPRGKLVRQRWKSKQTKKSRQVSEPRVDWERILMVDEFKLEFL